jgi:hypothetical protein
MSTLADPRAKRRVRWPLIPFQNGEPSRKPEDFPSPSPYHRGCSITIHPALVFMFSSRFHSRALLELELVAGDTSRLDVATSTPLSALADCLVGSAVSSPQPLGTRQTGNRDRLPSQRHSASAGSDHAAPDKPRCLPESTTVCASPVATSSAVNTQLASACESPIIS